MDSTQPMEQDYDPEEGMILTASCHDVRNFAAMLRGLSFSSKANVSIHAAGLQVTAEEGKILTATAYIPLQTFDEYIFKPENIETPTQDTESDPSVIFEVGLDVLLECLNLYGSGAPASSIPPGKKKWKSGNYDSDDEAPGLRGKTVDLNTGGLRLDQYFDKAAPDTRKTNMRMGYAGAGYPLSLFLAEEATGPIATCDLTTYEAEGEVDIPFDDSTKMIWVILSSNWLRDALAEFDSSCENVTIIAEPVEVASRATCLKFVATGTYGTTEMEYQNDPHVLETFDCTESLKFSYRLNHISRALRALQGSSRTSVRIDGSGTLSMQFLMNTTEGAFVEFRFVALEDRGDD